MFLLCFAGVSHSFAIALTEPCLSKTSSPVVVFAGGVVNSSSTPSLRDTNRDIAEGVTGDALGDVAIGVAE